MAPRIRTIKPEIWQDEKLAELSRDVRLLFIGLISMADDEGRLRAPAKLIRSQVFPYDDLSVGKVEGWLIELHEARLIDLYEGGGQRYARIPKWSDHQTVNRPQKSKIPPTCKQYPILKRASEQGIHDALSEDDVNDHCGNGMEGNGRGEEVSVSTSVDTSSAGKPARPRTPKDPMFVADKASIDGCFSFYCDLWGKTGMYALDLTSTRRARIADAIRTYGKRVVAETIRYHHANDWRHDDLAKNDIAVLLRKQNIEAAIAGAVGSPKQKTSLTAGIENWTGR